MTPKTIYAFWGLFGKQFSGGVFHLAAQLRKEGHIVHEYSWSQRLAAQIHAHKVKGPIGAFGHSLGANAAANFIRNMEAADLDVAGVVCIDPTGAKPVKGVPGYSFCGTDFRAKHVKGLKPFDLDLNHLEIDDSRFIHDKTIDLFK